MASLLCLRFHCPRPRMRQVGEKDSGTCCLKSHHRSLAPGEVHASSRLSDQWQLWSSPCLSTAAGGVLRHQALRWVGCGTALAAWAQGLLTAVSLCLPRCLAHGARCVSDLSELKASPTVHYIFSGTAETSRGCWLTCSCIECPRCCWDMGQNSSLCPCCLPKKPAWPFPSNPIPLSSHFLYGCF